ncbi:MAG: N-formylglutamate amidohydrolase [Geminicoccaceae bacterium]
MVTQTPKRAAPDLRAVDSVPPLLCLEDGPPVETVNQGGTAPILLICEHASNRMPKSLGELGLDAELLQSHIAFDPGAEPVARLMSKALDAPLILQRCSRLVYDCNRPPEAPSAVPARSEIFDIPGNGNLSAAERKARAEALYMPFHQAIADRLDHIAATGELPAIVTIHSFTPIFHGQKRSVELGILHDRDARLADEMLKLAGEESIPAVYRNEPYGPEDGVTHTLQRHALPRGLLNVMIEIRNDLIKDRAGQARLGADLARMVSQGLDRLGRSAAPENRQAAS